MTTLRTLIRSHPRLASLLLVLALAMKLLVPVGYMLGGESRLLTVSICSEGTGHPLTMTIPIKGEHGPADAGKQAAPCHFGALNMASLGGVDAPLLTLALTFIVLLGFAPQIVSIIRRSVWLQPPLRGPPLIS